MKRQMITAEGQATLDSTGLDQLRADLADHGGDFIQLGVLGGTGRRSDWRTVKNPLGLTNAEIGLRNEFGVISEGVPERSFLRRPMLTKLPGEIAALGPTAWAKFILVKGVTAGLMQLAALGEFVVLGAFGTAGYGVWPPNSPMTIALKGSAQPLIDTGQLQQAISWRIVEKK